jgi:long-subunit fatty acid transport protein
MSVRVNDGFGAGGLSFSRTWFFDNSGEFGRRLRLSFLVTETVMGIVRFTVTVVLLLALCASPLMASGFENTDIGVRARGMGGAFRAVASDWTAAYYNPAGYAFVLDNQLGGTLGLFHHRDELTPDYWWRDDYNNTYPNGMLNGQTLFNHHEILGNPSAGFVVRLPVWGETVFGLSAYQPFDYAIKWKLFDIDAANFRSYNDSVKIPMLENQFATDLDVIAFQLTAAREFKPEKLSLGIGLQLLRADLVHKEVILRNNPLEGMTDNEAIYDRPRDHLPQLADNDGSGWGFGLTGGALWKATEKLDVGFAARLPFEITISGTTHSQFILPKNLFLRDQVPDNSVEYLYLSGLVIDVAGDMETKLKLPPSVSAGLSYRLSDKFTVAVDAQYTLWSVFDGFEFTYSNSSASLKGVDNVYADSLLDFFSANINRPAEWDNAAKVMAGGSYDLSDYATLLGGVSYDQSPSRNDESHTPLFFDTGEKIGINGGLLFHIDRWDLGMVTSYTSYPDEKVGLVDTNNDGIYDSFPGEYKGAFYETVLSLNYRF